MQVRWALSDDQSPRLESYIIILPIKAEALVPFVNQYHSKPRWDIQPIRPLAQLLRLNGPDLMNMNRGYTQQTSTFNDDETAMRDERKCGFKKIIKIAMRKIIISCEDYIYLLKCFSLAFRTKNQSESFYTSFSLDMDVPVADSRTQLAFK